MPLQKQPFFLNFTQGVDGKTDPYQIEFGKFSSLTNMIFTTGKRLTKRNGYSNIANVFNNSDTNVANSALNLTTYKSDLIAYGPNLYSYNSELAQFYNKGAIQPVNVTTQSLVKNQNSQTSPDAAIAPSGLMCLVYMSGSNAVYQIQDSITAQSIIPETALPSTAKFPRAYVLGTYFIITFFATVGGNTHLQYITIPIGSPNSPSAAIDFSTTVAVSAWASYDGFVGVNPFSTSGATSLVLAWLSTSTTISVALLTSGLTTSAVTNVTVASASGFFIGVTYDLIQGNYFLTYCSSTNVYVIGYGSGLSTLPLSSGSWPISLGTFVSGTPDGDATIISNGGNIVVLYDGPTTQLSQAMRYTAIAKATYVTGSNTFTVVEAPTLLMTQVGLASKLFSYNSTNYFLAAYDITSYSNEPTYFLLDTSGNTISKLAYQNAGGFAATVVLPSVQLFNNNYIIPYLYKDLIQAVTKNTNLPNQLNIYTQTGVNQASFNFANAQQYSSEIADVLNVTGGYMWMFDGVKPVENNFHIYPELLSLTWNGTGGAMGPQPDGSTNTNAYFYSFCYEWTDNQGNLHRSAPSIPYAVTTTGTGKTGTGSVTVNVQTLQFTQKTTTSIRIVGYRWSVGQQTYHQFTSIASPQYDTANSYYITFTDTLNDTSIAGNNILYTTGGVVEDIAPPACSAIALYKNRLLIVDAEDRNVIWYSKQVIEGVPVEMSDLFTLFIAPTSGVQGSTGPITALSAMDDKLIIFKENAIYYITGAGPDNTGANNDFSDPTFITSSVGCSNPSSIVQMPQGLMFQSDKGIWLLGRDLSTNYIGAPVENYNSNTVASAQNIPATTQVRFVLNNNITLMYDYFYNQWGTFTNLGAISSTLYNNLDTYLTSAGLVYQETQGQYIDGFNPVLTSFITSWCSLAGIRGYERLYQILMLGGFITPFKLNFNISYDYNPNSSHSVIVSPDNYAGTYGSDPLYGDQSPYAGEGQPFSARVFPNIQKCQSFQLSVNEVYDPTYGTTPGQGLSLSGITLVAGLKKGYSPQKASRSFG